MARRADRVSHRRLRQFAWRGPWRALAEHGVHWDGGLVYSLSRAWLLGINPYEAEGVGRAWLDGGGPPAATPQDRGAGILLYPPSTLAALAPLGALPWAVAGVAWSLINISLYGATLWALARLGRLRGEWLLLFVAMGLWLAPATTSIKVGQTGLVVVACMALAAVGMERCRGVWAGVLMGIGSAIKPQLGLPFIVYHLGRLRWRAGGIAAAILIAVAAIGVARLQMAGEAGPVWYASWQRNVHYFQLREDGNPRLENSTYRHHMLNLHYPLHGFTENRELVNALVLMLVSAASLAYLVIDVRDKARRGGVWSAGSVEGGGELLSLSMTAVAGLLVVYHRFYDGVALLFPMALGAAGLMAGARRHWVTIAVCALYLVPGPVALVQLKAAGRVPSWIGETWAWDRLIVAHQAWALFGLMWWLVWLRWKCAEEAGLTRRST